MKDTVVGKGGAAKNNFPKHHALATGKQNKQGVLPGGSSVCNKHSSPKNHK